MMMVCIHGPLGPILGIVDENEVLRTGIITIKMAKQLTV